MIESLTGSAINVKYAFLVLRVSESGYCDWKDRPPSATALRRLWLAGEITDVHRASGGIYGAERVTAELRYGRDIHVGHNAVSDIMRRLGLKGVPNRRLPGAHAHTHADIHQVAALDAQGALLGTEGFPTTTHGYEQLLRWLQAFGAVDVVAVESTGSYAAGLTRHLRQRQVRVLEVNRPHAHTRRRRGKSDRSTPRWPHA